MEVNAGTGFIDFLPSVTCSPDKSFDELIFPNPKAHHPPLEGFAFVLADHGSAGPRFWHAAT